MAPVVGLRRQSSPRRRSLTAPAASSAMHLVRAAGTAILGSPESLGPEIFRAQGRIACVVSPRFAEVAQEKGETANASARSPLPHRLGGLLGVCFALSLLYAPPAPAASRISWGRCAAGSDAARAGFVCARLRVPFDYRRPRGRRIRLALVKHAAMRPARRVGTLFMNPGGPGGTGTVQIPDWYLQLPRLVRKRFDVVSWDPRGIGQSTAVKCFPSMAAEGAFLGAAADFPVSAPEKQTYIARWREFGRRCTARAGPLLRHVSTADTARDLDRLRRAVGARRLTYWGLSYGTILGATYANLFPSRVRALVLDGNIAPSAWTANGNRRPSRSTSLRIGSDAGAARDLNALLSLCGRTTVSACPFSAGSAAATRTKFDVLLARLLRRPITLGGVTVTYAALLDSIADGLDLSQPFQNPRLPATAGSRGWRDITDPLEELWSLSGQAATGAASGRRAAADGVYAGAEQGNAVGCGDAPNPRDPQRYLALEPFVLHRAGPIGLSSLWGDEPCSTWPARSADNYRGPWNRRPANPILVVGNTGDPATPYANSVRMAAQLRRARLLTVKGYGHTELLNPSRCANRHIAAYLLRRALPRAHTTCRADRRPFASGPGGAAVFHLDFRRLGR
jgi:pimeloyl-ACP methyl ester carboxylesterase